MDMQRAEPSGEVALGERIEILSFEKQDVTFRQSSSQALDNSLGQWLCEVDA
jgi:hypothetical protein